MIVALSKRTLTYPGRTLFLLFFLLLLACAGFHKLWLNTSFKASFDADDPLLMAMNEQENTFSKNDNMVVLVSTTQGDVFDRNALKALAALTDAGWKTPYVSRVDSLTNFNHVESRGDELLVEAILDKPQDKSDEQLQVARQAILNTPELRSYLVSADSRSSAVWMTFQLPENPTTEIAEAAAHVKADVQRIAAQYPQYQFHVTGTVEAANSFTDAMLQDMAWLLPIGYGLMIAALTFLLRSVWATVITLGLVTVTTLLVMGIKCWFDGAITAVNMFAPTMIMTIAIADCVHVLTSFFRHYRAGMEKRDAMALALQENIKAVFLTSLTTAVGFASLNFHQSPPYRELGNLVVAGVMVAWFLVYTLLPALIMVLPVRAGRPQQGVSRVMQRWADCIIRFPRQVLLFTLFAAVLVVGLGMPRNELNEMFTTYLDDSFAFKRANTRLNEEMGGIHRLIYSIDAGAEGGVYDPQYLQQLDAFALWLRSQPGVASVYSYSDVMKRLNRAMHDNRADAYVLPGSRELAAQYALAHEMSLSQGQELTNLVSMDKRKTQLSVLVRETDSKALLALNARAEAWLRTNTKPSMHARGVGLDLMFSSMAMTNIPSMVYGTFVCMALVALIIGLALTSWRYGLISLMANVLPVSIALGMWGFINGRIDIGVAAVGTLSFGIIVDDTIHFLHHYNHARRAGQSAADAVRSVFASSGLAMVTTTVALVFGFGILAFSHYSANANMGLLTATTMGLALLFDMCALPAWLVWRDNRESAA